MIALYLTGYIATHLAVSLLMHHDRREFYAAAFWPVTLAALILFPLARLVWAWWLQPLIDWSERRVMRGMGL